MGKLTPIPFNGPAYDHKSPNISAQQTINLYPEVAEDGEAILALIKVAGKSVFADFGASPIRGIHVSADATKFWIVTYNEFREVLNDGTHSVKGYLSTNTGLVSMADNGTHVLVVDGSASGYVYTMATGAWDADLHATAADFVGGDTVRFVDGYFFVDQPGTDICQSCTAPKGTIPTTWDALDVYASKGIGNIVSVGEKKDGMLWLWHDFGAKVFWNAGNATGFPFSKIEGADVPCGLGAKDSIAYADGTFLGLGKTDKGDRFIFQTQGYNFKRISTHAIEQKLSSYAAVDDAEAFTYIKDGHTFYQISFPTGNQTWCYDLATGMWHEKSSDGVGRDRARGCVFFIGKHLVGDCVTGRVGELTNDVYKEYDKPIIWRRRTQHAKNNGNGFIIHELFIDMLTGVGPNEVREILTQASGVALADGSIPQEAGLIDPQVMLRVSKDGGRTWGNEKWASAGRLGEYFKRVRFHSLGMARDVVFEISGSDDVQIAIRGGYARMEGLEA